MSILNKIKQSENKAGALLILYARINLWLNLPGKLALFALYIDRYGTSWWLYAGSVFFFIWIIFDFIYIQPQQADFGVRRSKSMRSMQKDIKWIRKKLEEKT